MIANGKRSKPSSIPTRRHLSGRERPERPGRSGCIQGGPALNGSLLDSLYVSASVAREVSGARSGTDVRLIGGWRECLGHVPPTEGERGRELR